MKPFFKTLSMLLACIVVSFNSNGQCDPVLLPDSSQFVFSGSNSAYTIIGTGNTVYVGGSFTYVGRKNVSCVSLDTITGKVLNNDTWPRFGSTGRVNKVISDGSGGWIIGGSFTQVGGLTRNNLVQINAAGQVTAWNPNPNGEVFALALNGTTVYVGGIFTTIAGQSRSRGASVDVNTGVAGIWNPGASNAVTVITINGTTLYMGGFFTSAGAQTRNRLAAWDLTTNSITSWNPNANNYVNAITIGTGVAYVGGYFTTMGTATRNKIAAVDLNTGVPTTWDPNGGINTGDQVYCIVMNGSNVLVGGSFDGLGSQSRNGIAQIGISTGTATAFDLQLDNGAAVRDILIDGNFLYIGGIFNSASSGAVESHGVAKANLTTAAISSWQSFTNDTVKTLQLTGARLMMGGTFTTTGYKNRKCAAALDLVADTVLNWNPQVTGGATTYILSLMHNAGKVYLGGRFTTVSGIANSNFACVDGVTGAPVPGFSTSITGINSSGVLSMAYYNSQVYLGGLFTQVNGISRNCLASVNATTGATSAWNPNPNDNVYKILSNGSNIYIGGGFTTVGGQTRNYIAAIDASTGTATSWNPNADNVVLDMNIVNNTIFPVGYFNNIGGQFVPRVAKLSLFTGSASTWSPYPDGIIYDGYVSGNNMYLIGNYNTVNGFPRVGFAQLDTTTNNPTSWNPGLNFGSGRNTTVYAANNKLYSVQVPFKTFKLSATDPSLTIVGNSSPCAGATTYIASTLVTGASFQWKVNGMNVGSNSNTYTYPPVTNDVITCVVTVPVGSCYTSSTATSNAITITPQPPVAPTSIVTTPNTTICNSVATTFTAATNVTGVSYQWQVNGINVGFNNSIYTYSPLNNDQVVCIVTAPSNGCFSSGQATSAPVTMTVNAPGTPSVTIAASANPVCAATSVTFTTSASASVATYQWKKGSTNVGTNSATYAYTPVNGDVITCVITTAAGACVTSTTATSNAITMTVTANATGTATITASANPSCTGATVTYTVTTNSTGSPTYQWQVNSANVTGATNSTYAFVPANGNTVKCIVTPSAGNCFTVATSNTITMTVTGTSVTPTAAITASSNPSCTGASVTYTATTNVIGATYQWQVNNANVGTNTATYAYTPTNNDQVKCIVTVPSTGCFTASQVTSNIVTMTVSSSITPTVSIVAASNPACAGSSVSFTATSNITGVSYQWKVNNLNVGANSNTYSYTPLNGDVVTCVATTPAGACVTATTATSNAITMTMTANSAGTGSIVASANPVCAGTSVTYSATTNIPGANYQWQVNSTNVGTNSSTYAYIPTGGNAINCIITATAGNCFTGANTNTIFMTLNPVLTPTLIVTASNNPACAGSTVSFAANSNVPGVSYQWQVNSANAGTNASSYSYVPLNNDNVTCIATMPAGGCYSAAAITSNTVAMSVTAPTASTATIAASANNICASAFVTYTATTNITNANYQWKVNSVIVGSNQNTYSNIPNNGDVVTCDVSLPATGGCFSPSSLTSNAITMTVTPNVTPTISITAPNHVAVGGTVNLTAVITNTPPNYSIDWKKNSVVFATTTVPNTSYTKTAGTDVIEATITATTGCYTPATASAVNVQDNVSVAGIGRNSEINIYPNPFSEKITIVGLKEHDKIQLFDLAGRLLHEWHTDNTANEQSFLVNDLANGSYFVKVLDANGMIKGVGTLKKL